MAQNGTNSRKLLPQMVYQPSHRQLLCLSASVGIMTLFIQSTLVTDSYRVCIVAFGMSTHTGQRTGYLHSATTPDVIMITDKSPVIHLHMVVVKLLHRIILVATSGSTMYYNH